MLLRLQEEAQGKSFGFASNLLVKFGLRPFSKALSTGFVLACFGMFCEVSEANPHIFAQVGRLCLRIALQRDFCCLHDDMDSEMKIFARDQDIQMR